MSKYTQQLAFLTVFLVPQAAIADVPAPPAADIKNTKKSVLIETPTANSDKPEEQQQQYPTPELVIRYKDGAKIEEYRVNGLLRYSKITPKLGPAYYLIDTNGDGTFDKRHDHLENPPIQQWLLYSW